MRVRGVLTREEIEEVKNLFLEGKSLGDLKKLLGYDYRTIKKYLGELYQEIKIDDEQIVKVYNITGCLNRTSTIIGLSRVTIYRRLIKNNIGVGLKVTSKRLYNTLRKRVSDSEWRRAILERDNKSCVRCSKPSIIVHHVIKLSDLRDKVIKENPELNPFENRKNLSKFLDIIMSMHNLEDGITLCSLCHDREHTKNPSLLI